MSFFPHLTDIFKRIRRQSPTENFRSLSPPLRHQAKAARAVKVGRAGVGGKDFWWVSGVVRRKEKILTRGERSL